MALSRFHGDDPFLTRRRSDDSLDAEADSFQRLPQPRLRVIVALHPRTRGPTSPLLDAARIQHTAEQEAQASLQVDRFHVQLKHKLTTAAQQDKGVYEISRQRLTIQIVEDFIREDRVAPRGVARTKMNAVAGLERNVIALVAAFGLVNQGRGDIDADHSTESFGQRGRHPPDATADLQQSSIWSDSHPRDTQGPRDILFAGLEQRSPTAIGRDELVHADESDLVERLVPPGCRCGLCHGRE